jgi:hypothetical protein
MERSGHSARFGDGKVYDLESADVSFLSVEALNGLLLNK